MFEGIKGYHGTPHIFEPVSHNPFGEFKNEAIGSGEGAQAYGWGHYIAGNPDIAKGYRNKLSSSPDNGALLEVAMKPKEHELLDWDRPLTEQSPHVRAGLEKLPEPFKERLTERADRFGKNGPFDVPETYTGGQFYKAASHYDVVDHPEDLSALLHKNGIRGIKYLDAASRDNIPQVRIVDIEGKKKYEVNPLWHAPGKIKYFEDKKEAYKHADSYGTKNYVIFDPKDISITGRNGEQLEPIDHDPFGGQ